MADMTLPTIVEGNSGFGGAGMGAGFIGGLVLGSLWNGNGFGFGGNNRGQAVADASLQNGLQNLANQAQQNAISQLQSANSLGMQIANAASGVAAGINANTVSALQSQNAMQQQMCCCCNNLSKEIDSTGDGITAALTNSRIQDMQNTQSLLGGMADLQQAVTSQGYESRLQTQALAAQLSQQHADLSRQIFEENCKDRELQREIQSQAIRDQLTQAQAQNAALTAQINLTNQLTAQTAYLVSQLKTETTPTAATAG